jgi:hypothetical protein
LINALALYELQYRQFYNIDLSEVDLTINNITWSHSIYFQRMLLQLFLLLLLLLLLLVVAVVIVVVVVVVVVVGEIVGLFLMKHT